MRVGVPREVKDSEDRVALTPAGVHELVGHGHEVVVERGAGAGSSLPDADYAAAGARLVATAAEAWSADLVCKVKEPVPSEYAHLRRGQVLFTYLHLAASRQCTDALLAAGTTSIAYETVQRDDGSLPLLAPMSEVAGRLATQVGASCLMSPAGGRGVLMGGVTGVHAARVVVLGAGVSGLNAAAMAVGLHADVQLLDRDVEKLRAADRLYAGRLQTVTANAYAVEQACLDADLVIGAVLVAGARAPVLVSNELVSRMKPGSVLVDISIDQGGCFEDSRPTTHHEPTFRVHESLFYCVANMPGAVPHTATYALTNVTLPHVVALADAGWQGACAGDAALGRGLTTHDGRLFSAPVAQAFGLADSPLADALSDTAGGRSS